VPHFDVAVVGAGPVGAVAALAHARRGARVALFEANPRSAQRLAGEWLHPPAIEVLRQVGIDLPGAIPEHSAGQGFVVFPDDGSSPCLLPYAGGAPGLSCEHSALVGTLRAAAAAHPNVDYLTSARVRRIEGHSVRYVQRGGVGSITAGRIVGADGRRSLVRASLGLPVDHAICSRMVGLLLRDVALPFEGYGHVLLGGPGPVLAYRITRHQARLILDVPLHRRGRQERAAYLWEGYAGVLPSALRPGFRAALLEGTFEGAANEIRARSDYGRDHVFLAGDAVGHHHPLTAVGITLGFGDALCLAECRDPADYQSRRRQATQVAELLAVGLYQALTESSEEADATRQAIYRMWRKSNAERTRTMRYLACQDTRTALFACSFVRAIAHALLAIVSEALWRGEWSHAATVARALAGRLHWLLRGILPTQSGRAWALAPEGHGTASAPLVGDAGPWPVAKENEELEDTEAGPALRRAVTALIRRQSPGGGWEGEVIWCPMLAAQYVLMCHITGASIAPGRKASLLLHFRRTQLASGLWGLHPQSSPYLFVTALVYVAARLLGVNREDPLLVPAARFIAAEGGVTAIPSWGKFWLALLNLYDWDGLNPLPPEAWRLPRWMPLHPGRLYCHTRLIYLAMSVIYTSRYQTPCAPVIEVLRTELYPLGHKHVAASRRALRLEDLVAPPTRWLRGLWALGALVERWRPGSARRPIVARLRERIRWELRTTDHTSISPVSGLLNMIALWIHDPRDPDLLRAYERFEGWIWEDDQAGTRVTGARSASWDTAFAVQALAAAGAHPGSGVARARGVAFLRSQQIRQTFGGIDDNFRIDPKGGWCFAGVWHGWPVSDCTAEAVLALLAPPGAPPDPEGLGEAVAFILRCQNTDGGFGSYEPSGTRWRIEGLNPAEMFADSMTDRSWVECTSSCIAALAAVRERYPDLIMAPALERAIGRAARWLYANQRSGGAWPGAWGVYLIYGTLFGVRGLLAVGTPVFHPAIRKACRWLLARQRPDGGWGEHHSGCLTGVYTEHSESQIIQTAWALLTLIEAREPDWAAIERGAAYLSRRQNARGQWPAQDMAGVFFRTALLDYTLYRAYFPLWALGLYQARCAERAALHPRRAKQDQSLALAFAPPAPQAFRAGA
ncbi:MAG: FAD-dependent monooxygenase, partial [Gammaproteobacteria bacterium]